MLLVARWHPLGLHVAQAPRQDTPRVAHSDNVNAVDSDQIHDPIRRLDQFAQVLTLVFFDHPARVRMLAQLLNAARELIDQAIGILRMILRKLGADLAQTDLGTVRPDDPHLRPNSRRT